MSILLSLFLACGAKQAAPMAAVAPTQSNIPDWVINPPASDKEICATGSSLMQPGMLNMAQQLAASTGRDELARQIEVHVTNMIKNYMEQGMTDGEAFSEQLAQSVSKQISDISLSGTVPVKNQIADGTYYSLVCLQTEKFASAFDNMNNVSEKAKNALRNRAKKGFDDLGAEVEALRKQKAGQ